MLRRARLGRAACSATLRYGALPRRTRLRAHAPRYARRSIGGVLWAWGITLALAHLRAPDKQSTSQPRITRSCRCGVTPVVRGLPPTPAKAQKKSFARYRSLIRGLPPTPAQAHEESLVRAATASLTSFVGYRPHSHKRRRSHSLATARSFVGYRPHPHKRMKNHSLVPL